MKGEETASRSSELGSGQRATDLKTPDSVTADEHVQDEAAPLAEETAPPAAESEPVDAETEPPAAESGSADAAADPA